VLLVIVGNVIARMVPQFQRMQVRIDDVNRILREQITGIRVIRAFVREPHEAQRFDAANDSLTQTALRSGHLMAFMFPTVMLVLNVSSVAAVWIGADRIDSGEIQVGSLIAFLTYLIQILTSVMMATFIFVLTPRAAVSAERIQEVLDTPTSVAQPENAVTEAPRAGVLELRAAGFRYPGAEEPVLTDVTCTVRPGETLAIIGSTGAGKSTLLNLVPRLADVSAGAVMVDGVDVRDMDLQMLWSRIGMVPQRPHLFSGTVADNLRHGRAGASDEELWSALEAAQAAGFVQDMPGGLQARIEQGGTNVSGGQRQRLAIARALVRRPGIYLFDDCFSALDLATEARLRAALGPWTSESAVVLVAQRVSSIVHADQILVLEDGHVVGLGTHRELQQTCPTYVEIVASQTRESAAA
jgi:ATP-binding cassette subfamily B protein